MLAREVDGRGSVSRALTIINEATKLLSTKYKTRDGASKRASFENLVAPGEHARGEKAQLYKHGVTQDENGMWRVTRQRAKSVNEVPRGWV